MYTAVYIRTRAPLPMGMTLPTRPRLVPALVAPITLLAPLVACAPDTPPVAVTPPHIADSAGVRIVTYDHTPTAPAPFQLAAEPRYRHGANPGDYSFQEASAGRLLPDGSAVVYDQWNVELVAFSPDGTTHAVLAAEGEGPGEVTYVDAIFVLAQDSILIADPNLARATLFVRDSVADITALPRSPSLDVKGIGSPGELLLATSYASFSDEETWRPGHMARFDMETGSLDTVASYDFMPRIPPGLEWEPIPAYGDVTVTAGHFVQTRSDRAEVIWRLADGTATQIVRWQADPALLTEAWMQPIEAQHRLEVRKHSPNLPEDRITESTRRIMAIYRASIGRPMPLFADPFTDVEGRVWLPSYKPDGERHSVPPYAVIAPVGEWLGTVETPPRFRILDVAGGLILGMQVDEMDVESVVVYELVGR